MIAPDIPPHGKGGAAEIVCLDSFGWRGRGPLAPYPENRKLTRIMLEDDDGLLLPSMGCRPVHCVKQICFFLAKKSVPLFLLLQSFDSKMGKIETFIMECIDFEHQCISTDDAHQPRTTYTDKYVLIYSTK